MSVNCSKKSTGDKMHDEINEFCEHCKDYSFFYKKGKEKKTDYSDAVVYSAKYECSKCGKSKRLTEILYRD